MVLAYGRTLTELLSAAEVSLLIGWLILPYSCLVTGLFGLCNTRECTCWPFDQYVLPCLCYLKKICMYVDVSLGYPVTWRDLCLAGFHLGERTHKRFI